MVEKRFMRILMLASLSLTLHGCAIERIAGDASLLFLLLGFLLITSVTTGIKQGNGGGFTGLVVFLTGIALFLIG
ncbi:MAG: hypothetical protein WAX77_02290 [Methylococcaceae bacterium]